MLEYSFNAFGLIPEDSYADLTHLIQQGHSTYILGKDYNFSIQNKMSESRYTVENTEERECERNTERVRERINRIA